MSSPRALLHVGFLFALASAALFAIRPIFVKLCYQEGVAPLELIMLRMAFSLPIYAVILVWLLRDKANRQKLNRDTIARCAAIGLLGYYGASYLDLLGLQYVSAQLGRMILYSYPTFVVILGALLFKQTISKRTVAALAITYLGVASIFGHEWQLNGSQVSIGGLYIVACAICFGFYLVFGKTLIDQLGSQLFTCIALIAASIAILVHYALFMDITVPEISHKALLYIGFIAIFCTVLPSFFTAAAIARIGPDKTSIVSTIGPAFTSIFAVLILSELFTVIHLLGIILTVAGIMLLKRKE